MKIRAYKSEDSDWHDHDVYVVYSPDAERLEAILKWYDIEMPRYSRMIGGSRIILWKEELEEIEKQYKAKRKK